MSLRFVLRSAALQGTRNFPLDTNVPPSPSLQAFLSLSLSSSECVHWHSSLAGCCLLVSVCGLICLCLRAQGCMHVYKILATCRDLAEECYAFESIIRSHAHRKLTSLLLWDKNVWFASLFECLNFLSGSLSLTCVWSPLWLFLTKHCLLRRRPLIDMETGQSQIICF